MSSTARRQTRPGRKLNVGLEGRDEARGRRWPGSMARSLLGLLALGVFSPVAQAAQETAMPAFLHWDVGVAYGGWTERSWLQEEAVKVGEMSQGDMGLRFDFRLGVLPGGELFGTVPYVSKGYQDYANVSQMNACSDTSNGAVGRGCLAGSTVHYDEALGSYVANAEPESAVPSWSQKGLDDVTIGLRYAPLHERELGSFDSLRKPGQRLFPHLITWRLEAGLVLNTGGDLYSNGPGVGATGFRLGTSFSKRLGVADPYLSVTHTAYGKNKVTNAAGEELTLEPADETVLLVGVELIPFEDQATGARFAVDFAANAEIFSSAQVESGTRLPSVTEETLGTVVTEEARLGIGGRIRLHYQLFRYLRLSAHGQLDYVIPHRLENPYTVLQSRMIASRFGVELVASF